ncbi:MAG: prenyltransferase [Actinomycetota bacterium]|nr:prenyltransferase [Actinomycetota bacterium]
MLTAEQRRATALSIAREQLPGGTIPWFRGGKWDPWDHVECVLGLDSAGLRDAARRGLDFLARAQRVDGAWACPIVGGREDSEVLDANAAGYIAVGQWHHFLVRPDRAFLEASWPAVERAIAFVLELQRPDGSIAWARNLAGDVGDHALLAGCSCIVVSLRCAVQIADEVGEPKPDWELAQVELEDAVRGDSSFADRGRYSMDWYYPVLSGALDRESARARLAARWDEFVVEGLGARCVNDRPWITSAETAELVMACELCGMNDEARTLFSWIQYQRANDGSYWTGATFPDGRHFPNERSTWSAAAMLLADDVLERRGPIADILIAPSRATEPSLTS